jgi:hypothetical protein
MTSPLGNFVPLLVVMSLKLARIGRSCQLSAISCQLFQFSYGAYQRLQQPLHFDNSSRQSLIVQVLQNLKIARKNQVIFKLAGEPIAICKNRANSTSPFRHEPSAMFAPTEADALRIWLVNPYSSSFGKERLAT